MTISAPQSEGFCRYGDENVLSTTTIALASCPILETASISIIRNNGFVGVSTQIILVLADITARTFSGLLMSTKWNLMPILAKMVVKIR